MVHEAVVDVMKKTYGGENAMVQKAMVTGVQAACPGECKGWEEPFQKLMLGWEQMEHHSVYGARTPTVPRVILPTKEYSDFFCTAPSFFSRCTENAMVIINKCPHPLLLPSTVLRHRNNA